MGGSSGIPLNMESDDPNIVDELIINEVLEEDIEKWFESQPKDESRKPLMQPEPEYKPEEEAPRESRSFLRSHMSSESLGTLDTSIDLPIIDVHCHFMGLSLQRTKESMQKNPMGQSWQGEAAARAVSDPKRPGLLRMAYYSFAEDHVVTEKCMYSMMDFCDVLPMQRHAAACPMLLDFGYTPLQYGPVSGKAAYAKGQNKKLTEAAARLPDDGTDLYYAKDAQDPEVWVWYPRDTASFRHTIQTLSNQAKLFPGQVWPFVPFDPRRPDGIHHVRPAISDQGFVGVKLYSRTGWMPYENKKFFGNVLGAKVDGRLDEFYGYVTGADIPILNHTSPTGYPPETAVGIAYPFRLTRKLTPGTVPHQEMKAALGDLLPPSMWKEPTRGRAIIEDAAKNAACTFANYCIYDQFTTSPYAWEPVLKKYPKLRLCFAHCGSKLAVFASDTYKVSDGAAIADCANDLKKNPMVAPARGDRNFRTLFKQGCIITANDMYHSKTAHRNFAEKVGEHLDNIFRGGGWPEWFDAWEAAYPLDWTSKIIELVNKYENVYTDISFITGDAASFNAIVGPLVEDALGQRGMPNKRLFDKCIIGTDWYMTEMKSLTPKAFWELLYKCILPRPLEDSLETQNRKIVWDMWSRQNALRYLNLKPRFTALETFYETAEPTTWWKKLKKHYDNGDHLKIPDLKAGPAPKPSSEPSSGKKSSVS